VATGHYCRKEVLPDGTCRILEGTDPNKDQTYFLGRITYAQLSKVIFPIGDIPKPEVRRLAAQYKLPSAERHDSQGICFLGKINYNDYIREYLGEMPGDIVELETGKKLGRHKGFWFHTIGQRKGMGFGGGPWFVVKKDVNDNILYVSHGYDPETAYKADFPVHDFHFLTKELQPTEVTFKIRHTPEYHPATLEWTTPTSFILHSKEKIHGVAPGQFCVIYDKEHQKYVDDIASRRKTLVSTGDRSAKIRTYNFPQGRVTDHRIGYTTHDLQGFLGGDIQAMIDALTVAENAERMKETEL